jgi:hypothetical protein
MRRRFDHYRGHAPDRLKNPQVAGSRAFSRQSSDPSDYLMPLVFDPNAKAWKK